MLFKKVKAKHYRIIKLFICTCISELAHRELELDGAKGDFADTLWRWKTIDFTK